MVHNEFAQSFKCFTNTIDDDHRAIRDHFTICKTVNALESQTIIKVKCNDDNEDELK